MTIESVSEIVVAIGGLGTAAFGLVDITKAFKGGISNVGFSHIRAALAPFASALKQTVTDGDWEAVLKANWINGKAKAEQKAVAKSLIRLGLTSANATELAVAANLNPKNLGETATSLADGTPLTPCQQDALGRLDAIVDTRIDAAFERADQAYRNAAKASSALVAVLLATGGNYFFYDTGHGSNGYFMSRDFFQAIFVGLLAVPLAPVAKDITSALGVAAQALQKIKGRRP